jgi:Protein of unknown function (DUF3866)
VNGRLKLRRGVVAGEDPLTVQVDGELRRAWADVALLGEMREGDEVVVNVAAVDLDLGSGGFDVVHVNLTRGLEGGGGGEEHVMKLNYTSLQHPVAPVELPPRLAVDGSEEMLDGRRPADAQPLPVLVIPLHGHLAPAAWGAIQKAPGIRLGYVQTAGGALPGSLSRDVKELCERGYLSSHVTAAHAYGGEHEAISTAGALDAAFALGWDAVIAGPGPGIIGSATRFGHGGAIAMETAHTALALGLPTMVSPRLSSSDPRDRHRGLSHHTLTLLELLLAPVTIPTPEDLWRWPGGSDAENELRSAIGDQHRLVTETVYLDDYVERGLPTTTMGRSLEEDPLFFASPLAAGAAMAGAVLRREE